MLHYLSAFALLIVAALAVVRNQNTVSSNYIVYQFGQDPLTTYFPFAFNKCQPASLASSKSNYFTCSADGNHVTVKTYNNFDCTGTPLSTSVINSTSMGYDTMSATYTSYPGAFNCNRSDEYVTINFGIGSAACETTGSTVTIYASINTCVYLKTKYLSVYCNGPYAELQYLSGCTSDTSLAVFNATTTCGYMFPFSTTLIYGDVSNCTQGVWPTTVTTVAPSSSSSANVLIYFGAFVVAVFASIFV